MTLSFNVAPRQVVAEGGVPQPLGAGNSPRKSRSKALFYQYFLKAELFSRLLLEAIISHLNFSFSI